MAILETFEILCPGIQSMRSIIIAFRSVRPSVQIRLWFLVIIKLHRNDSIENLWIWAWNYIYHDLRLWISVNAYVRPSVDYMTYVVTYYMTYDIHYHRPSHITWFNDEVCHMTWQNITQWHHTQSTWWRFIINMVLLDTNHMASRNWWRHTT